MKMAILFGAVSSPNGIIKEAAMVKYKIIVDAMVTIHPVHVFNIDAVDSDQAREYAKKAFKRLLDEQYGWADYDEANAEVYEEEEE